MAENQDNPEYHKKKNTFKPLKSLKKLFLSSKSHTKPVTVYPIDNGEFVHARSTENVISSPQNIPQNNESISNVSGQQLSISADSVFLVERFGSMRNQSNPIQHTSSSNLTNEISGESSGDELNVHQPVLDHDDGLPRSPININTVADVLNEIKPKNFNKWPSFDSGHSFINEESSDDNIDDEFFKWSHGPKAAEEKNASNNENELNLDLPIQQHALLTSSGPLHRINIMPKNRRVLTIYQKRINDFGDNHSKCITLPEVIEEVNVKEEIIFNKILPKPFTETHVSPINLEHPSFSYVEDKVHKEDLACNDDLNAVVSEVSLEKSQESVDILQNDINKSDQNLHLINENHSMSEISSHEKSEIKNDPITKEDKQVISRKLNKVLPTDPKELQNVELRRRTTIIPMCDRENVQSDINNRRNSEKIFIHSDEPCQNNETEFEKVFDKIQRKNTQRSTKFEENYDNEKKVTLSHEDSPIKKTSEKNKTSNEVSVEKCGRNIDYEKNQILENKSFEKQLNNISNLPPTIDNKDDDNKSEAAISVSSIRKSFMKKIANENDKAPINVKPTKVGNSNIMIKSVYNSINNDKKLHTEALDISNEQPDEMKVEKKLFDSSVNGVTLKENIKTINVSNFNTKSVENNTAIKPTLNNNKDDLISNINKTQIENVEMNIVEDIEKSPKSTEDLIAKFGGALSNRKTSIKKNSPDTTTKIPPINSAIFKLHNVGKLHSNEQNVAKTEPTKNIDSIKPIVEDESKGFTSVLKPVHQRNIPEKIVAPPLKPEWINKARQNKWNEKSSI